MKKSKTRRFSHKVLWFPFCLGDPWAERQLQAPLAIPLAAL